MLKRHLLAGRDESRARPARHGAIGHRGTETQRKPHDSLCLGVSVAHFSVSRSPWDDFCHGLRGDVMKTKTLVGALGALLIATSARAQSKLNVVTTTEDLASIAREVGGDRIAVESIARGYQDPHFVEAKPSFILKLQKADLLVLVGRELEIGWLPPLITQSRNGRIQAGAAGYLDASLGAAILEIPTGQITRAMGDVHPLGNPHYWLDPENGKRIAKEIADKLSELRPNEGSYFQQQLASFTTRLDAAEKRWLG